MAIFYFAGHGVEVGGVNYLIPINATLNSEADVRYNALSVNRVLDNMDLKRVRFKLLILDACRDNPFTRGWTRSGNIKGLAHINAPKGTLIAFSKILLLSCQKPNDGTLLARICNPCEL